MIAEQEMLICYLYLVVFKLLPGVFSNLRVIDKGILPLEKNSVAILFFMDIENVDRLSTCQLKSRLKKCCLKGEKDCEAMDVYGGDYGLLKPRNRVTLLYVYPSLQQHDQEGFCDFVLDYQCGKQRRVKRQEIHTPFDTRLSTDASELLSNYIDGKEVVECDTIDQDSLNDCAPVDCEIKYTGKKPFFNVVVQKCVPVPTCGTDINKELPNWVYEPQSNTCRDLDTPLTLTDVYALNSRLGVVTESTKSKDVLAVQIRSNLSTISQNLSFLESMLCGNVSTENVDTSQYCRCCRSAILAIVQCIIILSFTFIGFICCVDLLTWVYRMTKSGKLKECLLKHKNFLQQKLEKEDMIENEMRQNNMKNRGLRKNDVRRNNVRRNDSKNNSLAESVTDARETHKEDPRNRLKPFKLEKQPRDCISKAKAERSIDEYVSEEDSSQEESELMFTDSDTTGTSSDDKGRAFGVCECEKCCKHCTSPGEEIQVKSSSSRGRHLQRPRR